MIDEALLRVLSTHVGVPQTFAQPPEPISGGYWAATYGFELAVPPADHHVTMTLPLERTE